DQWQRQEKAGQTIVTAHRRGSAFGRPASQGVGVRVQGTLQSKWIDIGTAVFSIERPSRTSVPLPLSCPDPTTDSPMITMVVPTRDRAHTLRRVADSYFCQRGVSEIVFVIDAGADDTVAIIENISRQYPAVRKKIVHNPSRVGASQSRNRGVAEAANDFILFCDDDEY